jgi:hypothetical protein
LENAFSFRGFMFLSILARIQARIANCRVAGIMSPFVSRVIVTPVTGGSTYPRIGKRKPTVKHRLHSVEGMNGAPPGDIICATLW